jgi:peptidoglycan L-alanyl-D-glutamate endopeptidase CwlK
MDFLKQAISSLLSLPIMNPHVQKAAKHLSRIALYGLKGTDALQPDVRERCLMLIIRMNELGKSVYLSEGFRTAFRQDDLYAQGRNKSGPIITQARGLQSYHNYGLAFDLIFQGYDWNPPSSEWWEILGREGKALGLTWGGDWQGFRDLPHFEYCQGATWEVLQEFFKK